MKKNVILFAAGLICAAPMVMAEDSPHEFSANVALTTDYVFRGISQTNEKPAVQGGFDYSYTPLGAYLGVWASNVDFGAGDGTAAEIDYYGGISNEILDTGVSYDIGVLYYNYPGGSTAANEDYIEYYGGLGYDFDTLPLKPSSSLTVYYSPDFFGGTNDAQYYDLSVDLSLPYDLTLAMHAGYQNVQGIAGAGYNYGDYKLGLSRDVGKFNLDLSYYDVSDQADACGSGDICDSRVVFTVSSSW